jgi:hypothetical protein
MLFDEPFAGENTPENIPKIHEYHYFTREQRPNFLGVRIAKHFSGEAKASLGFLVSSNGPDCWCDGLMGVYHPTNGLRSSGDILKYGPE